MGVAPSTISRIKARWETEHTVERREGQGRPRATTAEEDERLVRYITENPFTPATVARMETNFPATSRTARSRLSEANLHPRRAAVKEILNPAHREARIAFANAHAEHGEEFWRQIIFSDEKTFSSSSSGPVLVYRPNNTRFCPRYIWERARSGRFSVHAWAWICADGPGVCWRIDGNLNGDKYVQILDNVMLPSVSSIFDENFIFQQNSRRWFQTNHVTCLKWPARSPDLNPIENVWAFMMREMQDANVRPRNVNELWEMVKEAWERIPSSLCHNVVNSMSRRLNHVIENEGGWIPY
ncbi:hypothetical protein J437_LFUL001113 [Ladona fulva]|uniref:Transposase n=1 Tax=Ladona fulva TaxID=123851 RepID=A0A8K0JXB2_LADFU|nr:hypothetical protein J437_LFUL001113 [Ladona fulva]